jgi:hypothetical protein
MNGEPISRATALPAINLGLAMAVIAFLWILAGDVREAQVTINATETRQTKYIQRRNEQHVDAQAEVDRLHGLVHDLELRIVVLETTGER